MKRFILKPLTVMTVALSIFLSACNVPPYNSEEMKDSFKDISYPQSFYVSALDRKMHYVSTQKTKSNQVNNPLIIFAHGAPAEWSAFGKYLADKDLRNKTTMISIDRLGYGLSEKGKWEESLKKQAALLNEVVKKYPNVSSITMVGHSFGGPVIARYAIDYPDSVDKLVFLAPAVDPELEKVKWFQIPANWSLVSPLIPSRLNVANKEILPLKGELTEMLPLWSHIKSEATVIQGKDDTLVPKENAMFIKRKLPSAKIIYIENEGHFIPWTNFEMIKQEILPNAHLQHARGNR